MQQLTGKNGFDATVKNVINQINTVFEKLFVFSICGRVGGTLKKESAKLKAATEESKNFWRFARDLEFKFSSSGSSSEASAHSPGILDNSSCSSVFSPLPKAKSPEVSANHSRFGRDSGLGDSQLKSFSFPKNPRRSADTSRLSPNSTRISENSLIDPYAGKFKFKNVV